MRLWDKELMKIEKPIIEAYLKHCNFSHFRTAKALGITRATLGRKIERYKINNASVRASNMQITEHSFALRKLSKDKIKAMIEKYFDENDQVIVLTADILGINRYTLARKLRDFDIK